MKSELYLWRRFDLRLTSTTHLVCFLHKQQTPLSFSLLSSFRPPFFFLSICLDFLFKCRRLISCGVSPPSAPQLIVTGPSITAFALYYYYTRLKVRMQNKAAATLQRQTHQTEEEAAFLSSLA